MFPAPFSNTAEVCLTVILKHTIKATVVPFKQLHHEIFIKRELISTDVTCAIKGQTRTNIIQVFASRKKNGFVTATKLGKTNKFFVAATKNFAAATKRFVDRTKRFVAITKCFCYPYFNK